MGKGERPRIVVAEPLGPEVIDRLKRFGTVVELEDSSPNSLINALSDADALLVRTRSHVTARIIDAAPRLRVIGRAGASLDHIDMKAAERRNITVVYTPTVQVVSIAEFTVAIILATSRRILWYDRQVRDGQFDTLRTPYGREMRNQTIGLLGGGPVADEVCRIMREGFHARVIAHTPETSGPPVDAAEAVDLRTLLRESDVLSIHMPPLEKFNRMIGAEELAQMKHTACVINTSRGRVIVNEALAEALKTRQLAGAALDVFDAEPLPVAHPLRNAPKCILTPHIAGLTLDVAYGYAGVADDVIRVLQGESPQFPAPYRARGADSD